MRLSKEMEIVLAPVSFSPSTSGHFFPPLHFIFHLPPRLQQHRLHNFNIRRNQHNMDVAAEILAEMALTRPEEPTCHFMRLPLELRKRVYAHLLLPPPVARTHCSILPNIKQCSPGGRFLASTCKPKPTSTRTVGCGTCEWRGGDVHTAILAVNRGIYEEASDVLYENSQAVCYADGPLHINRMGCVKFKIRRFVCVLPIASASHHDPKWPLWSPKYCNVKVVELHFDIDLTKPDHTGIDAMDFRVLTKLEKVEVVVDVHIVCAWEDVESEWNEPITRREQISEARALELDEEAHRMRLDFVNDLQELFEAHGKTLVVREN